ncbi:MAG: PLP-dependent transferase [Gammaproteobacteria bacterium]|nr:PLP-dependent transferase [Gammaproteobacteria bacterium]
MSDRDGDNRPRAMQTLLAQLGHYVDPSSGGIVPPLQPSTTFARDEHYELPAGHVYGRDHAPIYAQVESLLCSLEGGARASVFSSGLAAIVALFETVPSGAHIVAPRIMYFVAQQWFRQLGAKRGISLSLFDATDPEALARAIRPGSTDIVWIETATNPTWDVIDIARAAEIAHAAGALLCVDSTVSPPVTTRPLEHGADLVFHSATKYLNGHSDVVAGALIGARDDERWREIAAQRALMGGILGPFEAWLLLRGMRTLSIRFERASANALEIARRFEKDPRLEAVRYPGLATDPSHPVARRQMRAGFGGMLSLLVEGGFDDALRVATRMRIFVRATSLGGVESLVEHRASIEGPSSPTPVNLLRLSVGIEAVEDLIEDIDQALDGGA